MRKRSREQGALGRRIGVHDRRKLELKLEYHPGRRSKSRYAVDVFMFTPSSLNIAPDTVPPEELYADIHNYMRLKTPVLSFAELEALPTSPLLRAEEEAARCAKGAPPGPFIYECKVFACVVRAALREIVPMAERPVGSGQLEINALRVDLDEFVERARSVLVRFRALESRVSAANFPKRAQVAHSLADEWASVSLAQALRNVIAVLERAAQDTTQLRQHLVSFILDEERYRRDRGYPSLLDPDSDNEAYVSRAGLLKKYCSSALFLQIRRTGARRHWQELFYAMAAGIAMAFATVVAFWAQAHHSSLGMRLFVILVIAYMFKDRLKDGARAFFTRVLERHLYDRKTTIDDPAGGKLGACREKIEYMPAMRVPRAVQELRLEGANLDVQAAERDLQENVYHYRKEIFLISHRVLGRHGGYGITDIVRFHVARLLKEMDEPDQEIFWVDRDTLRVITIRGAKVYHVDVVVRLEADGEPPSLTLLRLVLDRRGIKRIEQVEKARRPAAKRDDTHEAVTLRLQRPQGRR
ncbi:MAG: hypothetical protein HY698_17700 [Deltaproteobacteria bacterium]|nr:hypothetical protein [Deltaproteobacteria bacterium]